jgi:protein-tyrosine-phosphatase
VSKFRILAVCSANICRSPVVEILLRQRLDASRFKVRSAGTFGWAAAPVDSMVVLELARLGASAEGFASHALTRDDVEWADLILTATREHRAHVLDRHPAALRRTFTLREFASLAADVVVASPEELVEDAYLRRSEAVGEFDLDDPFRRPPAVHRVVADQIANAVEDIAEALQRSAR